MGRGYLKHAKPFLPTFFMSIGWFLQPYGKSGDVFFFIAVLLSLIGATFYLSSVVESQNKENEAVRIKQFLSHQRHDWMNDVQIILGYLTLQKMDRMKSYLEQQVQKANDERLLTQLHYAPLAITLITLPRRYLQWRMNIKVENIAEYTIQEEKVLLAVVDAVFPWLEKQLQDSIIDIQLNIHIIKNEKMTFTISILEESNKSSDSIPMNDLAEMRKTIRKWNGDFSYNREWNEIQIKL